MFKKSCKGCGVEIEGARNLRKCKACTTYVPRQNRRTSKFSFDPSVFENKDFRSYFLGFLCSDGSAVANKKGTLGRVGWYSSDREHIQKITDHLKYDHPIYLVSPKGKGEWGNYFLGHNARLIQEMGVQTDKELHSLKSFDIDFYPFLRAHMDGDGSVSSRVLSIGEVINTVTLRARKLLAEEIREGLEKDFGKVYFKLSDKPDDGINRTKDVYEIMLGSTRAESFLEKVYKGATIWLDRKRAVWDRCKRKRAGTSMAEDSTHNR